HGCRQFYRPSLAGHRGFTGTYGWRAVLLEPSARVFALWEHENAYTDSLGTLQTDRNFATGRASGGVKVSYPLAWSSATNVAPYLGVYGDFATGSAMSLSESVIATKHPTLVQVWIACRSGAPLSTLIKTGSVRLRPSGSVISMAPLLPSAAGRAATET